MRFMLLLIMAGLLTACNESAKNKDSKRSDTLRTDTVSITASTDTVFRGLGTEPFWFVYIISREGIVFQPAEGARVEVPWVEPVQAGGNTTEYHSVSGESSIDLLIRKEDCSDGMSEIVHPYSVSLTVNGTKYEGCGKMK